MKKIIGLFLIWGILFSPISLAHFHYKMSATAELQENSKKQLTAVAMSWLYDPTVSGMMLKSGQNMDELAKGMVKDLVELDNFTQLKFNGRRIVTERVTQYQLMKINQGGKIQMKFSFVLPLQSALFIQGNTLSIAHTDPGASASIFYHRGNNIVSGSTFSTLCRTDLKAVEGFEVGEAPETISIHCGK
jgi:ABC-type uncharacterized transport system substrate-binding protein